MAATSSAYLLKGLDGEIEATDIKISGKRYILLLDVCKANGIEWEWDSVSRKIALKKNGRKVVLMVGSKYYYADERIRKLGSPVEIKNGNICIPLRFVKYTLKRLFVQKKAARASTTKRNSEKKTAKTKKPSEKRYRIKKIVIDPGHGGRDPGAVGRTGLKEKDVVLDISKMIKKELEKDGIDVVITRNSDKFISLDERARISNKNNADLFISIHANASRTRRLRGFEVYFLSEATDDNARALASAENSVLEYEEGSVGKHTKNLDAIVWDLKFTENRRESIELAGFICQGISKRIKLKRNKVRSARFYVLKGTEMPGVLVELSYLSNRWDEKNLKKTSYRQKLAKGVAAGIIDYKQEYERTNGFSR